MINWPAAFFHGITVSDDFAQYLKRESDGKHSRFVGPTHLLVPLFARFEREASERRVGKRVFLYAPIPPCLPGTYEILTPEGKPAVAARLVAWTDRGDSYANSGGLRPEGLLPGGRLIVAVHGYDRPLRRRRR